MIKQLSLFLTLLISLHSLAQSYEYVDLGLPSGTLWAACNLGALKPDDKGNYYMMGDISAKTPKGEIHNQCYENLKYDVPNYNVDSLTIQYMGQEWKNIEYLRYSKQFLQINKEYDIVIKVCRDNWEMPTLIDYLELLSLCKWNVVNVKGINGLCVRGLNKNEIFLPLGSSYEASIASWDDTQQSKAEYLCSTVFLDINDRIKPLYLKVSLNGKDIKKKLISTKGSFDKRAWLIRPVKRTNKHRVENQINLACDSSVYATCEDSASLIDNCNANLQNAQQFVELFVSTVVNSNNKCFCYSDEKGYYDGVENSKRRNEEKLLSYFSEELITLWKREMKLYKAYTDNVLEVDWEEKVNNLGLYGDGYIDSVRDYVLHGNDDNVSIWDEMSYITAWTIEDFSTNPNSTHAEFNIKISKKSSYRDKSSHDYISTLELVKQGGKWKIDNFNDYRSRESAIQYTEDYHKSHGGKGL